MSTIKLTVHKGLTFQQDIRLRTNGVPTVFGTDEVKFTIRDQKNKLIWTSTTNLPSDPTGSSISWLNKDNAELRICLTEPKTGSFHVQNVFWSLVRVKLDGSGSFLENGPLLIKDV